MPLKLLIIVVVLVICVVTSIGYFKGNILPVVLTMSEATVKSLAVNAINNAAQMVIDEKFGYQQLVSTTLDGEGNIQFIQIDTLKINRLTRDLASLCQNNIEKIGSTTLKLPIGAFTGSVVFSGMGPKVDIALMPIGSVMCDFQTSFEEVGINQTRHSIYININTTISLVLPVSSLPVYTSTSILVCENIIVGKVPDVYVNSPNDLDMLDLIP